MTITMELLVAFIRQLEESDVAVCPYLTDADHRLVHIIARMLEEIFITPGGHMDYDAKDKFMETYGYELYPVEHDRWGWILGGLQTKKGTIVFG
jgi:hypothetical protein